MRGTLDKNLQTYPMPGGGGGFCLTSLGGGVKRGEHAMRVPHPPQKKTHTQPAHRKRKKASRQTDQSAKKPLAQPQRDTHKHKKKHPLKRTKNIPHMSMWGRYNGEYSVCIRRRSSTDCHSEGSVVAAWGFPSSRRTQQWATCMPHLRGSPEGSYWNLSN